MVTAIHQAFSERYGKAPLIVAAPGRVNLIGEHTDYNMGFVLPGAVDKCIYVAMAENGSSTVNVFARRFGTQAQFRLDEALPREGWVNYLIGMTQLIQQAGHSLSGADVWIDGDLPVGSGMSSSAALCTGYGYALSACFDLALGRKDLAQIAQKTEHEFAGVKCGLMDQFAILFGKAGHLLRLDCRSLEFEYVPFQFPEYRIVLVNSGVHHNLASSEYNIRRQQCEEGVRILKAHYPGIQSLRDLSYTQLLQHKSELSPVVFDRCRYVIGENARLLEGCRLLERGAIDAFGKLLFATHDGLSQQYAVSCAELDFLVDQARQCTGVAGSRMMGGGFGGCTINLVRAGEVTSFERTICEAYAKKYLKVPEVYVMHLADGVRVVNPA